MIRQVAEDHALGEALWLVKNGMDFDLAVSLSPEERAGMCIRFGVFEGGTFSWENGDWEQSDD